MSRQNYDDDILSGSGWNRTDSAKKDANNIAKIIIGVVIGIIVIGAIIFGLTMKGTNEVSEEAKGGKKTIEDLGVEESSDYTPDELNIRNTLDADLKKMQTDLDTISEYKTRLENLGIQVPDLPEMIAGDVIKNNNGTWNVQLSLNGGITYNWQNHSLKNGGYMEGASADDIQSMIDSAKYDVAFPEFDSHWYYTDGTEFILSQGGFSQTSTDIQNAITGYQSACNQYVSDKRQYQCEDLISLLELEINYKKSN